MDTLILLGYFALLFFMDVCCVDYGCRKNETVCGLNSTACECEEYYHIARLCYFVNLTSEEIVLEMSSEEQPNFVVRVEEPIQSQILRFKTKPSSCRFHNLTDGNYKIKIYLDPERNDHMCFCGIDGMKKCEGCNFKVMDINYTGNRTLMLTLNTWRSSSTHVPTTTDWLTLSTHSATDSPRKDLAADADPVDYKSLVIVLCTSLVVLLTVLFVVWQCKGEFRKSFHSEAIHQRSLTTEEGMPHPESPLTESVGAHANQSTLDSGFESISNGKCSILFNAYNGDEADSVYDEKWGAFSIPKPVTYELEYDTKSENDRCIPKEQRLKLTQQLSPLAPSDLYFSPPEDQSLAASEEMIRINSAYMRSIIAEKNQYLTVIKELPDDEVRVCQVCRSVPSKKQCQEEMCSPKTLDMLSLGGKSV